MRYLDFEWSDAKAATNLRKHKVDFREAASVLRDTYSLTIPDDGHADVEDREITTGISSRGRILTVVHTERGKFTRLISARRASAAEENAYEERRSASGRG